MNLDDPRLTAMGLFAEVHNGVIDKTRAVVTKAGLSEVDFECLLRLARSPGQRLRMSDLAAQTELSTSGITRVIDRMEREGLVVREACLSDRRASYAVVTDQGRARVQQVLPDHIKDIETWFTGLLEPAELEQFLATLRKIRDLVRPGATAGAHGRIPPGVTTSPCAGPE